MQTLTQPTSNDLRSKSLFELVQLQKFTKAGIGFQKSMIAKGHPRTCTNKEDRLDVIDRLNARLIKINDEISKR